MGRVTNVRAYMRNGRPVRAHTRGVPDKMSGAGVVALLAVIGAFLLWGSGADRTTPATGGKEPRNSAYSAASPWAPVTLPDESPRLARPSWAGSELQGYRAGSDDCGADARLWVVQPGTSGMYRLTSACFGGGWKAEIVRKCRSYSANLPPGRCAVWDRDGIMSAATGVQGELQVVVLTDACLTRAGLSDFHVGPLHRDCVVAAS